MLGGCGGREGIWCIGRFWERAVVVVKIGVEVGEGAGDGFGMDERRRAVTHEL